jgi:hypothetical protein
MRKSILSQKLGLALAGALVALSMGFLAVQHFSTWNDNAENGDREHERPARIDSRGGKRGFREAARESGIAFRMNFLPSEQGENFKINLYDHGCGVVIADFNGDGHDDVYFLNQLGANALYQNRGDGTFVDVTRKAGVGLGDRVCVGAVFCDYDNDGHPDLFVTSARGGNVLFHNEGDGTFKDVTNKAGVFLAAHSQTAVFFDYNNDGWPDLFVTNSATWTSNRFDPKERHFSGIGKDLDELLTAPKEYNVLYRNNGDGTFTNVTAAAGLSGKGWGGDVAVFDFDEDGWRDLLVTNMFGNSQLYRNNGDGSFSDVTKKVLGKTSMGAIAVRAFDFNNDGKLDLFITDMHSDMWIAPDGQDRFALAPGDAKKKFSKIVGPRWESDQKAVELEKRLIDGLGISYEDVVFGNTLFQNLGNGRFAEVSEQANMETFWPWGIATGDFNNDGREDVFLPSGMGYPYFYWPNALMMNNGDGTFSDRAKEAGIEPPPGGIFLEELIGSKRATRSSRCAAVADFDGDGRLDLMVNNFNDRAYYFKNEFPSKNYVAFRLQGNSQSYFSPDSKQRAKSCRDAIGALVRIYHGKEVQVRQLQAAGGYLSQCSNTVHFGLGDWPTIDRAEIRWPSGRMQVIQSPAINRRHQLNEPN